MTPSPSPYSDAASAGRPQASAPQSHGGESHAATDTDTFRLQRAMNTAVKTASSMPIEPPTLRSLPEDGMDVIATEVLCARHFNTPLPDDITEAIEWLNDTIARLCQVKRCALFIYDDERDLYLPLTTQAHSGKLSQLSDDSLAEFLGTDNFIHGHLLHGQELLGLIAIAEKTDGIPFDTHDECRLDILGPYLAATLVTFKRLKASAQLSTIQRTVLAISSQLIKAVDQENVLSITLEAFGSQLGFDACQYIQRIPNTAEGEVLLECMGDRTKSFMHAGLQAKRATITDFDSLLGLFKSAARPQPYLLLPGNTLGSQPLSKKFSLPLKKTQAVSHTLILPVLDPASGRIRGTLNLYRLTQNGADNPIEQSTLDMAQELIGLVSLALSRVMVLEMALEMASTDELTGLTNRRGFYDRFESEIERARRVQSPMCVAMLDVDFFKKINDSYGHLNGDAVLHQLGQVITQRLRKSDLVCRFGGEEFAILLPDTKFEDASELLDRIRLAVAETPLKALEGKDIPVTISAGLAQVRVPAAPGKKSGDAASVRSHAIISQALESADKQLYLAKHYGRNKVCATCE